MAVVDRGAVAHLGASQVIEIDIHVGRVVRVIDGIDEVHGVLVVPAQHRVYGTATGANRTVTLDEDAGQQLAQAPTGDYPDGLAYDPDRHTLAVTRLVPLPGCDHDHGLALDPAHQLAFVACDANATLLSVDLNTWQ